MYDHLCNLTFTTTVWLYGQLAFEHNFLGEFVFSFEFGVSCSSGLVHVAFLVSRNTASLKMQKLTGKNAKSTDEYSLLTRLEKPSCRNTRSEAW